MINFTLGKALTKGEISPSGSYTAINENNKTFIYIYTQEFSASICDDIFHRALHRIDAVSLEIYR